MGNPMNDHETTSDLTEVHHLQTALETTSDVISRHDIKGTFLYVSPSCKSLLGYEQHELKQKSILDICHPMDLQKLKHFKDYQHPSSRLTFRARRKEGDYIWIEVVLNWIDQDTFISFSRDVTQQMVHEEEIKQTREKYRLLVEYSKDTIGMITRSGIWTYINTTGKKLLGTTSHLEVIGTSLFDYTAPYYETMLEKMLKDGKNAEFDLNIIRNDQQIRQVECQLIPTTFKNRRMYHLIMSDVTDQKKTEERLQNTEKLSVVGQLAAGIAHEIRNPLTAIKGFTQLLKKNNQEDYQDIILSELERIEQIVSDLLILAKPQVSEKEEVNIIPLVQNVITLLNTQAVMSNILIKGEFQKSDILVECEPNKIKQVLINLIKNAIEAMPDGGDITVTVSLKPSEVLIHVIDQGLGIPHDRLEKLGEPFYSTKEKGTGLGLMICKKIIKNHGGEFQISSQENIGTTVEVRLPYLKS